MGSEDLAVGFESGFIKVWDVLDQECIANLSLSDSQIVTAAFSKDGYIAALGSGGRLVQVWDIRQSKCINTLYCDHRITQIRMRPDGRTLHTHIGARPREKGWNWRCKKSV